MSNEDRSRQGDSVYTEDFVFEMANLKKKHTNVEGFFHVTTKFPRHAPRVKWYPVSPQSMDYGFISLSIEAKPVELSHKLDVAYSTRDLADAKAWIGKNAKELRRFWDEGSSWDVDEIPAFVAQLEKL